MNQRQALTAAVALAVLAAPLITASGTEPAQESVSFARDIAPLLRARCARCHMTGDEPGRIALYPAAAYGNLVGVPSQAGPLLRVKPRDPRASYLIVKLEGKEQEGGADEGQMPRDLLSQENLDAIRRWIALGAADN